MANKKNKAGVIPIPIEDELVFLYDSGEFALTDGQSDYDVKDNVTGAFERVKNARCLIIRTDKDISVKFNDSGYRSISVSRAEGSFTLSRKEGLVISNIFVTNNSGATANVKIILIP